MNTQPPALRERASSADLLVSFYLQACRKAAVQMEAPVSQESFKQDLRHLAEDLKQFEDPPAPPTPIQPSRSPSLGQVEPLFVAPQQQNSNGHGPHGHSESNGVYHYIPPHQQPPGSPGYSALREMSHPGASHGHSGHTPATRSPAQAPAPPQTPQWTVDPKSLGIARELQNRLNLGSEAEALRMLIALGAERAKQLFP